MTRKENTVINYRPELSEILSQDKNIAISLYKKNMIAFLYRILIIAFKDDYPEHTELLTNAAECLESNNFAMYEIFDKNYRKSLNKINPKIYGLDEYLGDISETSAARHVFGAINTTFIDMREKVSKTFKDLTLGEKYLIDTFYNILTAPTRNPNIQISKGQTKCYYDEHPGNRSFKKDLNRSIEYINENCAHAIELFNTPD